MLRYLLTYLLTYRFIQVSIVVSHFQIDQPIVELRTEKDDLY